MNPDPQKWGVDQQYRDVRYELHTPPEETISEILRTMGATTEGPEIDDRMPWVLTEGEIAKAQGDWHITLEGGTTLEGKGEMPADLPLGYHSLSADGHDRRLYVTPATALSFEGIRKWGWSSQLYSMRSKASWGIGDLGDLDVFAKTARSGGAGFVLLNPLHASIPGEPQQTSPYYPSSREFRNPLYIDISQVPGASGLQGLEKYVRAGQVLNKERRINRDEIWKLKVAALEILWELFPADNPDFTAFREQMGYGLHRYATYCALREEYGLLWAEWPQALRHPNADAVKHFAAQHADRVLFHEWMQWLLDVQFAHAGADIDLINDLAIGVDPAGADAWIWQDTFALNMRVGAPPDEFNQRGQDWGLPPFDPWRLRLANYEPFIRTIRSSLMHARGIRIDHVMGLFRLYWIPEGMGAADGTYVQYPWRDLLGIVALESQRAQAYVVGEDLGTVEAYMRDELAARNIASYKLLWFEDRPPSEYPQKSMAAVTTHDLPTIAGLWTGSDLALQDKLGMDPNIEATENMRRRVGQMIQQSDEAPVGQAADACHSLLATASSALVSVTLEDALRLEERPNFPGTTDEWPNWSVALPLPLEDLVTAPGFLSSQETMASARHEMSYHDVHDPQNSSTTFS
jgi:4-alpha-glucanotransferase